jgi:UDP-glucose 4-epimerase
MSMRVLVTGGAGFIGSHLVEALLERGDEVIVLDNLETGRERNLAGMRGKGTMTFLRGDIRDPDQVADAMRHGGRPVEGVLHQAALPSVERSVLDPAGTMRTNVEGTANILHAARVAGVQRVVYASSSSVYGDTKVLPKDEEMTPCPQSPYAVSKLAGEHLLANYRDLHGMATVSLRYFNIFGPRQDPKSPYAAVIPLFLEALLAGEPPRIHGDGKQSRDFTYIDNVVQANLRALKAPKRAWGRAFNIGCGDRVTINRLTQILRKAVGGPKPEHGPTRAGDVKHSQAAIEAARKAFGYEPGVELEEGLMKTAAAFTATV